jgi:hypothetical protein
MMENAEQAGLLPIVYELEKKYPFFKKMDIYTTVSDAHKKAHHLFNKISERELEEIKEVADRDLSLSL